MQLWTLILAFDLGGWLFGWRYLIRPGKDRQSPPVELVRVVWFGLALALVGGLFGRFGLGSSWATLRLWTHGICFVLAPLLVVRAAFLWRRARWVAVAFAATGSLTVGLFGYASWIEPYRLEITRYVVESDRLRGLPGPVKVVVLADLQAEQIGEYEREVFRAVDAERADLVLLPGDYLQIASHDDYVREQTALVETFRALGHEPRLGIWAVEGDIDAVRASLAGTCVRILCDETVSLRDVPIQLVGLSLVSSRRPLPEDSRAAIERFPGLTIIVGHAPEYMLDTIGGDYRPEALMLAGHTHGGQVVIPGFGPPITLSSVPRRYAAGGLFSCGASTLCISRGIGLERGHAPRLRLFCRPQLVVIELVPPR
jgi:predicted MPP superfamily phosphohydrolase